MSHPIIGWKKRRGLCARSGEEHFTLAGGGGGAWCVEKLGRNLWGRRKKAGGAQGRWAGVGQQSLWTMARRVGRFCSKRKWKLLEGFKQEKDII